MPNQKGTKAGFPVQKPYLGSLWNSLSILRTMLENRPEKVESELVILDLIIDAVTKKRDELQAWLDDQEED